MRLFKNIAAVFFTVMLVTSCGTNAVYDQQVDIPAGGWYKDEAVHFDIAVTDTAQLYDYWLTIRHSVDYRYSNLYLFLNTKFPNGNVAADTLECILATDEGKWLGKGWGSIKEDNILLRTGLKFPLSGTYDFYIRQAMRHDTLKGIVSVGLRLTKTEQ